MFEEQFLSFIFSPPEGNIKNKKSVCDNYNIIFYSEIISK